VIRRRASQLATALALVVGLLAVPAGPAAAAPTAAPPDFLGSNTQSLFRSGNPRLANWPAFLGQVRNAGFGVVRFDASWALAEPEAPGADGVHHYTWAYLDGVARALARAGQRWLPVVDLPPRWAQADGTTLPDATVPGFVAFATAFTQRYGADGAFWRAHPELEHLPITQVEVWTEANSTHFWAGDPDPGRYLSVFNQVRDAMKAVDPGMQVLVSLGWQEFWNFTTALYDAGLAGRSDGIGFHPYAPTPAGIIALTRQLRTLLTRRGEPDLPIYITEIGQPDAVPGATPSPTAYTGAVSDAARAASASAAADALAQSDCNLKGYAWYSLVEPQTDPANVEDWLGLVNADGSPTATLQALGRSARRWAGPLGMLVRGGRRPMMDLCHGRDARDVIRSDAMTNVVRLPLQLHVPMPARGPCMTLSATYDDNPLEDVSIFVRNAKGRQDGAVTKAAGTAQVCANTGGPTKPFLVWARSGGFAASPVLSCKGTRCLGVACASMAITSQLLKVKGDVLPLRLSVNCGGRVMSGEPVRITGVGKGGVKHRLAGVFTGPRTQVVKLPWRARWQLRYVRVQFRGDKAFRLRSQSVYLRLPRAGA
jgi:hypothetical protein